jgi:anhydro-N-acetylmuramic acid kinase
MMRVIGLISGTSMDAIDAAVVDIEDAINAATDLEVRPLRVALRAFVSMPYPDATRAALESILPNMTTQTVTDLQIRSSLSALASLNVTVGEAFASAAIMAHHEAGGQVDLIGSHGQTIAHLPRPDAASGLQPATWQVGEAAVIAERTGLTCVADFRPADIAAGGQGAPLVSYVDHMLMRSHDEYRVALNIGGIANVTLLPPAARPEQVLAFDTGPGNMPIDLAVRQLFPEGPGFDRNGQIAARGRVHEALLQSLLADAYFAAPPPKTAGREQFGPDFVRRTWERAKSMGCTRESLVATLTELTARSVADQVPHDCRRVIAAGGGVHNKTLMNALRRGLSRRHAAPELVLSDEFGFPADAKEAMTFAILAYEAVHGRANDLPSATGAAHPAVLGKIIPGANFSELMRSVWR